MMPASPPPPTDSSRPFQAAAAGSQTSNLIAGSTTPATRQIAGTLSGCGTPGAANVPLTLSAVVIFVSGSASFAKSAQVAADAAVENRAAAAAAASVIACLLITFPSPRKRASYGGRAAACQTRKGDIPLFATATHGR